MDTQQLKELYDKYFYYIMAADIGIGLLLGVIPLLLGIRRNKRNLGLVGLILAGAFGAVTPLLSIVIAAIFTFLVLRNSGDRSAIDTAEDITSKPSL